MNNIYQKQKYVGFQFNNHTNHTNFRWSAKYVFQLNEHVTTAQHLFMGYNRIFEKKNESNVTTKVHLIYHILLKQICHYLSM